MLQTIREQTQGWIAGVIITLIILSFALWGIHSYFVDGGGNNIVAEVNGVQITKSQLGVAYERLRRKMQMQYGSNNLAAKDEAVLKERALQSLIEMEVLTQASIKQGYRVSDAQIDGYLQSIPEFQVDGRFSVERFQELLASTQLSTSEFLDLIKTSLLIDQPKLGIIFTSFALPDESNYTISLVNQERNIDYINIPLAYFAAQPISIPSEKIKAFYERHKKDFMTPEQASVEYIEVSLKDFSSKMNPTDSMLKNFYSENINSYTQPMEWKLTDIEIPVAANATPAERDAAQAKAAAALEALKNGKDFAAVAHQYPTHIIDQDWMSLSQVPQELQKAVVQLNTVDQLSDLIKTKTGYVILKVLDTKAPAIQTFDTVKDKVKESYVRQHAEEKFTEVRDQLASVAYEHPDSLQQAANLMNLPIQTSDLFTREKAGKGIAQYKKVRDVTFSDDVLNLQNNSDVILTTPETMVVLRIKSHINPTLLPLTSVSKQIEDKLKTEEAEARAEKFAASFKSKLQSGVNADQLAKTSHFIWNKAGFLGRYSTKVDSAILDMAFRLPNPAIQKNAIVYGMTRLPNGYAIVALKAVKPGSITDKKQYFIFAEQVQNSEGLLEYELYKRSQMSKDNSSIELA